MSRIARLGAFIIVTLAILAAGVFIIGSKAYLFRSTYQLKAQFDNVAGLAAGADVQVGGVHSGTVHEIDLPHKPGEQVTVLMDLDSTTHEIIKADSVASIETEGVLGNQYVAISFGSPGQADVKNGQIIASEPPLEMSDLFKKASGILDGSQVAIHNVTLATDHLNSISAKIDTGQGTVGALVNDKQLYNNLQQTTATLQTTIVAAQAGATDFQENMEALKHNFLLSGYFKKRGYEDSSDLTANSIGKLPQGTPMKVFTFSPKQLFDAHESTKLNNKKSLKEAGEFLTRNPFGLVVIAVSSGMEGDSQKDLTMTEARALAVRNYLVENFEFDDSLVRTQGLGKQPGTGPENAEGSIQILVFPVGTEVPADKPAQNGNSSKMEAPRPVQGAGAVDRR